MKGQNLRERLRRGDTLLGSWISSTSPVVAELMALHGFDFLCVDVEHSAIDLAATQGLFQAMRAGDPACAPFVRAQGVDYPLLKRYMDAGARGVVAPLVNSREEAQLLVDAVKYPPLGRRGVGYCRANGYGLRLVEEFSAANDENMVVAQIEHIRGVENIDAILSVEGIDAVFIGPYDLSASMGLTAQFDHPDYLAAKRRVLEACGRHKVAPGIHVVQPEPAAVATAAGEGFRFIAYTLDITILNAHLKGAMRELREALR